MRGVEGVIKMMSPLLGAVVLAWTVPALGVPLDQPTLDALAEQLQVRYTVVGNRIPGRCGSGEPCLAVRIDLTSDRDVTATGWTMSFSQLFPLRLVESDELDAASVNGDLTRITPKLGFTGFRAGKPVTLTLYLKGQHGNQFEIMPNYWLDSPGLAPRTVRSTVPVIDPVTGLEQLPFLTPFTNEERQFRIDEKERIRWMTPERLYATNAQRPAVPVDIRAAILPTPVSMRVDPRGRALDLSGGIQLSRSGVQRADVVAALARLARQGVKEESGGISVTINLGGAGTPESYTLDVAPGRVRITAPDSAGAFYGLQSLASLVGTAPRTVPLALVTDAPRYPFRGLLLDVARNFHSKLFVLALLDQMAAVKLNRLHLHMGDDEGWRLQIPGLPELTEVGARRCADAAEDRCIEPQLGSGPSGVTPVNGYYSVADYEEILRAATARHIEVIPSFDMPGHSRAAVRSMESRRRRFLAAGNATAADHYRLIDPDDRSDYSSIQNYHDNTINVCVPGAYAFFAKVVGEVQAMHAAAGQPLRTYHIGADETAGAWRASPACRALLAQRPNGISLPEQLGGLYIERLAAMLTKRGLQTAAWSDGLTHADSGRLPPRVQSNEWLRLVDDVHRSVAAHVNLGWDVVLSIPDVLYFDFPALADPKERGYYWASRQTDERRVFDFMPDNLPALAEQWTDQRGLPLSLDDRSTASSQPIKAGKGIAGIQAQLWSETLRGDEQVAYMAFPRLLFFAERAWHRAAWEVPYDHEGAAYSPTSAHFTPAMQAARDSDWNRVSTTVILKALPELDRDSIDYRIPTVGAIREGGVLRCNLILPGLPIEYRRAGGSWQRYTGPASVGDDPVEVRALSADGHRRGRAVPVR